MHRIEEMDVDGRMSVFVEEDYDNEALNLFEQADDEAGEEVIYLYEPDSHTGEPIELYRNDWL